MMNWSLKMMNCVLKMMNFVKGLIYREDMAGLADTLGADLSNPELVTPSPDLSSAGMFY